MTFLIQWVDPKDHMVKVSCQYLYYWLRYRLNKENRPLVIMPTHPKLTQVPRVIHYLLDVVGRTQGSYAESFMSISLLLAEIQVNKENRHTVIMATHPKLTQVPRVIHDVLDVVDRPQQSYAENFVSISISMAEIQDKQRKETYSDHANPPKTYPSTQGHP